MPPEGQSPSEPPPPTPVPPSYQPATGGWGPAGEVRSPVAVILLWIFTCGIYSLYYWYKTFQELKDHANEGIGGGLGLVLGIFLGIINVFLLPSEVGKVYERAGLEKPVSGITGLWVLLPLIGFIIWVVKVQGALNRRWEALEA
jgi:hypothetical protein